MHQKIFLFLRHQKIPALDGDSKDNGRETFNQLLWFRDCHKFRKIIVATERKAVEWKKKEKRNENIFFFPFFFSNFLFYRGKEKTRYREYNRGMVKNWLSNFFWYGSLFDIRNFTPIQERKCDSRARFSRKIIVFIPCRDKKRKKNSDRIKRVGKNFILKFFHSNP